MRCADRKQALSELSAGANRWIELFETGELSKLPDSELTTATITYLNSSGNTLADKPLAPILAHVFNHSTHHRGQISAALTSLGLPAPEMDLLYYVLKK